MKTIDRINDYIVMLDNFDSSLKTMDKNIESFLAMDSIQNVNYWHSLYIKRKRAKERIEARLKDLLLKMWEEL